VTIALMRLLNRPTLTHSLSLTVNIVSGRHSALLVVRLHVAYLYMLNALFLFSDANRYATGRHCPAATDGHGDVIDHVMYQPRSHHT